jgi:hypothetical protein
MATLTDVGGLPGVGAGFLQPKQQNKWRVQFLGFGNLPSAQPLSLQAKSITRPDLTFESHELHRYNSKAKVLGKHTFGDMTIVFDDDIGSSASKIVQAQMQRQQFIIGAEGPFLAASQEGSFYKFATVLDMLNGNDLVIESWTYEGCMITGYKGTDLDYSSSDLVTIELTISIDHAFQCFPNSVRDNLALGGAGIPC